MLKSCYGTQKVRMCIKKVDPARLEPRALLENMRPSRVKKGSVSRTLSREEMEEKLDKLFRVKGEATNVIGL